MGACGVAALGEPDSRASGPQITVGVYPSKPAEPAGGGQRSVTAGRASTRADGLPARSGDGGALKR